MRSYDKATYNTPRDTVHADVGHVTSSQRHTLTSQLYKMFWNVCLSAYVFIIIYKYLLST